MNASKLTKALIKYLKFPLWILCFIAIKNVGGFMTWSGNFLKTCTIKCVSFCSRKARLSGIFFQKTKKWAIIDEQFFSRLLNFTSLLHRKVNPFIMSRVPLMMVLPKGLSLDQWIMNFSSVTSCLSLKRIWNWNIIPIPIYDLGSNAFNISKFHHCSSSHLWFSFGIILGFSGSISWPFSWLF